MSGGEKMLLFGSFTEDETKLFQGQPLKSPNKSVNKECERTEIQFGTLNFSVLSLEKVSTSSVVLPAKSANSETSAIAKENTCSNEKKAAGSSLPNGRSILANGCPPVNVPANNGLFENVKKTEAVVPPVVPVKSISIPTPQMTLEVHNNGTEPTQSRKLDKEREITENGSPIVDTPIAAAPAEEAVTNLNKKTSQNMPLIPQGLRNTGNICFLNATLQALLSCSPFVHLLQDLRNRSIPKFGYPTLRAFVELISQFDVLDESVNKKNEKAITVAAKPLNPAMFDDVLRNFTPDVPAGITARPRQEDAQEFLSFAMDRVHDELLKLNGNGLNSKEGMVVSSADDAWETVGRKNKSAIVRTHSFVPSELSAIFGGQLQSVVKAAGNKASATVQPFLLLHLDIFPDAVQTLNDALRLFSTPESLEGYRTTAGKAGLVTARKSFKIHALSKIMILHLKRFSYGNHGSTKIYKPLRFTSELVLSRDLLSSPSQEGRKYELVATITHHGRDPYRGHYTAHAKHADGQWLRFDDDAVVPVGENDVLHDQAYVLFYKQV